jgi:hypothetical protein
MEIPRLLCCRVRYSGLIMLRRRRQEQRLIRQYRQGRCRFVASWLRNNISTLSVLIPTHLPDCFLTVFAVAGVRSM